MIVARIRIIIVCLTSLLLFSCNESDDMSNYQPKSITRSILPEEFDWEVADTMPTPKNQARIYMPWDGPGSIADTYGDDVLYDYKKSDGWILLYNSFTSKSISPLVNPYFILYNKYNGLLRLYQYITTSFVTTSSSMEGTISVSNKSLKLLNFMGESVINGSKSRNMYKQILPAPINGGCPLASNKWYMMQYEMAYDPNVQNLSNISMSLGMNYYDVTSFKFQGDAKGSINGTIGLESDSKTFSQELRSFGSASGKAILTGVGKSFIDNQKKKEGGNKLGLSDKIFNKISSAVTGAFNSATNGLPAAALGLINGILGGSKTSCRPINLSINVGEINLSGTGSNSGSLPSMPCTIKVPGMKNMSTATGIIPLYNEPLGIFNFTESPEIRLVVNTYKRYRHDDPWNPGEQITEWWSTLNIPQHTFERYIVINPSVLKIADVDVKYDLIADEGNGVIVANPQNYYVYNSGEYGTVEEQLPHPNFYVQVKITVTPKNGDGDYVIYKSFALNNKWVENVKWLPSL